MLIDGATKIGKHEIKKGEDEFVGVMMAPLVGSLIQPVASLLINAITEKWQKVDFFHY